MELRKLAPWNWFKNEEADHLSVPIKRRGGFSLSPENHSPFAALQQEMDRLFDSFTAHLGASALREEAPLNHAHGESWFSPRLDIEDDEKAYIISMEIAGVGKDDIQLEIHDHTLCISEEKKQKKETAKRNHYRMERRYGSLRRVLSLPGDSDSENISAVFSNGVLTVTIPRAAGGDQEGKRITIH